MVKFNITYFYSEGIPNDNGKDLKYCKELLLINSKCFDNVSFYTPKILSDLGYNNFLKQYDVTDIIEYYSTACKIGLLACKPLILLLELEKMQLGDILLYRDSDFKKYPTLSHTENIISIIDNILNIVNFDVFISREKEDYKLRHYTKPIVLKEIGNDDIFNKEFPLLIANFIIIRKSKISIDYLNEWKDACLIDKYMDGYLYDINDTEFRNFATIDQSIAGTIIANWVKERKYNIPLNYPIIGFEGRDISKIIYFKNYDYLKYLQN